MSTMPNPPDKPSIDLLMKLIQAQPKKGEALQKLAEEQVSNQPVFQGKPTGLDDAFGRITGSSANQGQRGYMSQIAQGILNRDRSKPASGIAGALSGMDKGMALVDQMREKEKANRVGAAKIGMETGQQQISNMGDVLGAQQQERRLGQSQAGIDLQKRRVDMEEARMNQPKMVEVGGRVYKQFPDGKMELVGDAKDDFTLSKDQMRFDANGNVIAEGKNGNAGGVTPAKMEALEESATVRQSNIQEAIKLRDAFESGASSGAGRKALGFLPGVYTDQGRFDEQLDTFAEKAARAELKAMGEVRPTDADVKGMKEAMFGKGRDEQTNKNLLDAYIRTQLQEENIYRQAQGLEPVPVPEARDLGDEWYTQLYEKQTGRKVVNFNDLK